VSALRGSEGHDEAKNNRGLVNRSSGHTMLEHCETIGGCWRTCAGALALPELGPPENYADDHRLRHAPRSDDLGDSDRCFH
jgi:hypothetical protein